MRYQSTRLLARALRTGFAFAIAVAALTVATTRPASAQDQCSGEGFNLCGFVWDDANNNGVQDDGETGRENVTLTIVDGTDSIDVSTDLNGFYQVQLEPADSGSYTIYVSSSSLPAGTVASPSNVAGGVCAGGVDEACDSDGVNDTLGNSVVTDVVTDGFAKIQNDFGFYTASVQQPGTGTPGYWKNHPAAWPVNGITIGGTTYTKAEAIAWLGKVGKDKTTTMFSSLVPAKLNVLIGNTDSCVATSIASADAWMAANPLGSKVAASSQAWAEGEPWHRQLDAYNNGLLCAPHRD
jgi:hypothetical protein